MRSGGEERGDGVTCMVFVGPTLGVEEARAHLDAVFLPPAGQGDVYRAALGRPEAIGLVDGFFERVPSVWHKEILWALTQGIPVYGSASMGALRAAEMEGLGMVGVGKVFDWYRSGMLEDDDEVALLHGPAETGYKHGSEPLVNMRATFRKAERTGILSRAVRERLEGLTKDLHYTERSYGRVLRLARQDGVEEGALGRLEAWLPGAAVDLKREDAVRMLVRMRQDLEDPQAPPIPGGFEHTVYWEQMVAETGESPLGPGPQDLDVTDAEVLDELRLDGALYAVLRRAALARNWVRASQPAPSPGPTEIAEVTGEMCRELNVRSDEEFYAWLGANRLSAERFGELVRDEAAMRAMERSSSRSLRARIVEELKTRGRYEELAERCRRKRALAGDETPGGSGPIDVDRDSLVKDHFERIGGPVPADLDEYARGIDLPDGGAFCRILERERRCSEARR